MTGTPHSPRARRHFASKARRGGVLVAVLAIIALLSFLVVRFMDEAVESLEYRTLFNEPPNVRSFGYSMMEVALATINEVALIDEGKLYASEQGWGNPLEYANISVPDGWQVSIEIQDLSTKLPINTINEALLNGILEDDFDIDFGTTRELSSTLLDWIDADEQRRLNGAESEDYLDEDPAYRAANGPLQSLEELRLLDVWQEEFFDENGQPNELFSRLEHFFSVEIDGKVNINTASMDLLEAMSEREGWNVDRLFDQLRDQVWFDTLPDFLDANIYTAEIGLLRVTVRLQHGDLPFIISALLEPSARGGAAQEGQPGGNLPENPPVGNLPENPPVGNLPGSDSDSDIPKTGVLSEQEAIQFPFRILELTEYGQGSPILEPARYSAVDIEQ